MAHPSLAVLLEDLSAMCHGPSGFAHATNMLKFLQAFLSDLLIRLKAVVASKQDVRLERITMPAASLTKAFERVELPPLLPRLSCTLIEDGPKFNFEDFSESRIMDILHCLAQSAQRYFTIDAYRKQIGQGESAIMFDMVSKDTFPEGFVSAFDEFLQDQFADFGTGCEFVYFSVCRPALAITYRLHGPDLPTHDRDLLLFVCDF